MHISGQAVVTGYRLKFRVENIYSGFKVQVTVHVIDSWNYFEVSSGISAG